MVLQKLASFMKYIRIVFFIFCFGLVGVFPAYTQPPNGPGVGGPGGGGPGGGGPGGGQPVPLTGIELLIGAGALLGAKRVLASRKSKT